jgi:hypothetical protein
MFDDAPASLLLVPKEHKHPGGALRDAYEVLIPGDKIFISTRWTTTVRASAPTRFASAPLILSAASPSTRSKTYRSKTGCGGT